MKGSANRIRLNVSFFHITTSLYCHIALHSALHVFQRGEAIANTFCMRHISGKPHFRTPLYSIFGYIAPWPPLAKLRTFQMFQNISRLSHFLFPILENCCCLNSLFLKSWPIWCPWDDDLQILIWIESCFTPKRFISNEIPDSTKPIRHFST